MTLAPVHSVAIRGVKGPQGMVAPTCSANGCISKAQQRHHLWPKSYLRGQPYEWVQVPWGKVVQNTTGLCIRHHDMVTIHKAAILVEGDNFMWAEREQDEWMIMGPLFPQPHVRGDHAPDHTEYKPHDGLQEGETCPACGYQRPRKREKKSAPRETSTWGVTVPKDTELGSEVLDEWIDNFAVMLGLRGGELPAQALPRPLCGARLGLAAQAAAHQGHHRVAMSGRFVIEQASHRDEYEYAVVDLATDRVVALFLVNRSQWKDYSKAKRDAHLRARRVQVELNKKAELLGRASGGRRSACRRRSGRAAGTG